MELLRDDQGSVSSKAMVGLQANHVLANVTHQTTMWETHFMLLATPLWIGVIWISILGISILGIDFQTDSAPDGGFVFVVISRVVFDHRLPGGWLLCWLRCLHVFY